MDDIASGYDKYYKSLVDLIGSRNQESVTFTYTKINKDGPTSAIFTYRYLIYLITKLRMPVIASKIEDRVFIDIVVRKI